MSKINIDKYRKVLDKNYIKYQGRVSQVVGLTIESIGPISNVGDICFIKSQNQKNSIMAEVVGFRNNKILLMPLGEMLGIGQGSIVETSKDTLNVAVGHQLLGRVLDGLGHPIDDGEILNLDNKYPVQNSPPHVLKRNRIKEILPLGIKAIDGLLTVGKGQRVGIFAGSGVGKSTLLGMIARNAEADLNVIALIGERGREVREFIEKDLKKEGLKKSVIVVATSDQPALIRLKAAQTATAIAEYFRDQGKNVLLLMDSLTRFAMAQREVGLAIGEPPVTRGYTPSVFAVMPKLLERAGNSDKGSITGLYTVLVDGDDMTEPVTDTVRGILDGHIVLSRKIANRNQYPAIDILQSISRVMNDIISDKHKEMAFNIKKLLAVYKEAEDLINIGAYVKGSNEEIDEAVSKYKDIYSFLTQKVEEKYEFNKTLEEMQKIVFS
ncbi:flagellar protein export ATPase FliI [Defluviitalea phaphyphila]|uniref:flagellar protein export ATPase FliI n=1 Tax=Defluviitalea phaphyphila TaxID=1473580 RepID=UPI0007318D06|nr:flagellar protein export ATPase FliI [Defluviitalea phaphyphila]